MGIFLLGIMKKMIIVSAATLAAAAVSRIWGAKLGYHWRKVLWLALALYLLLPIGLSLMGVPGGRGLRITVPDPAYFVQGLVWEGRGSVQENPAEAEKEKRRAGAEVGETGADNRLQADGEAVADGRMQAGGEAVVGGEAVADSQTLAGIPKYIGKSGLLQKAGQQPDASFPGPESRQTEGGTPENGLPENGISKNGISKNGISENGQPKSGISDNRLSEGSMPKNGLAESNLPESSLPGNALSPSGIFLGNLLIIAVWAAVFAFLLRFRCSSYQKTKKRLLGESEECAGSGIQKMLADICREYHIRRMPPMLVSRTAPSPMLFGYVSPVVLLPDRQYDEEELRLILCHELIHYRSGDLWYKLLLLGICDLYWFNPLLRLMRSMAYQDVEYVCDDRVVKKLPQDEKKLYGNVILRTMADAGAGRVSFGTQFSHKKKNAEKRFANIFAGKGKRNGYIALGILLPLVAAVSCFVVFSPAADAVGQMGMGTEAAGTPGSGAGIWQNLEAGTPQNSGTDVQQNLEAGILQTSGMGASQNPGADSASSPERVMGVFDAASMESLHIGEAFDLSSYYITNRSSAGNRFFIDEEHNLWGYGCNEYGQLGNGAAEFEAFYKEPVKIAENVISVDKSINNYFTIYLTGDGKLYGMGTSWMGILGGEAGTVTKPVLLMEDVSYARAGMESIAALKKDGSVWWWGQYNSTYSTAVMTSQGENKLYEESPVKLLDNCIYATTGSWTGAAISAQGELYTWGLNIFGECGVEAGQDYIKEPGKVLEGVKMVWPENLFFNDPEEEIPDINFFDYSYGFNMFVELLDGSLMACGLDLGEQEKTIEITGDIVRPSTHRYAASFVPVAFRAYSEEKHREALDQCAFGMDRAEAEAVLEKNGLRYWTGGFSDGNSVGKEYLVVDNNRYFLYFDEKCGLESILLQYGGSRNSVFTIGMSLEEIKEIPDISLQENPSEEEGTNYWCVADGIYYELAIYDNMLQTVTEYAERPMQPLKKSATLL